MNSANPLLHLSLIAAESSSRQLERGLPRCATFTRFRVLRKTKPAEVMASAEGVAVALLGLMVCGVVTVPVLKDHDIWGDGTNFVNGSEGFGEFKQGKG